MKMALRTSSRSFHLFHRRSLLKHLTSESNPLKPCHKPSLLNLRWIQSQPEQPQQSPDLITPICNHLLSHGANWDSLTANFATIQLTDTIVERVLITLGEPTDVKKALAFFHWSSNHQRFQHGLRSCSVMVQILVRAGLLADARALLESSIKKSCEPGRRSSSSLVDVFLSVYELVLPGPRVFDLLVQSYSKMRMAEVAFATCHHLGDRGFQLSLTSFNTLLHVAQRMGSCDLAWKVYEYMLERRVYPNQATTEIMVGLMCKNGELNKMVDELDHIHGQRCAPGVVVNAALGFRIFKEGRVEEGILLLKRLLQKNMTFDGIMYSMIIFARCRMGQLETARTTYDEMLKRGGRSNAFVYTAFIGAHCMEGKIEEAIHLMQEMRSKGVKPYNETYNYLVEGCSRMGRVEESLAYYEEMLRVGYVLDCDACNEMISKLCEAGDVDEANGIVTILIEKGFVPNEITYLRLIEGYGKTRDAQGIVKLCYEMEHNGLNPGLTVYTAVVENLCSCGKLNEAEKFLSIMKGKSLAPESCIYDALITACCQDRSIERALFFYDEMISKNFKLCADTFMLLVKRVLDCDTIKL